MTEGHRAAGHAFGGQDSAAVACSAETQWKAFSGRAQRCSGARSDVVVGQIRRRRPSRGDPGLEGMIVVGMCSSAASALHAAARRRQMRRARTRVGHSHAARTPGAAPGHGGVGNLDPRRGPPRSGCSPTDGRRIHRGPELPRRGQRTIAPPRKLSGFRRPSTSGVGDRRLCTAVAVTRWSGSAPA